MPRSSRAAAAAASVAIASSARKEAEYVSDGEEERKQVIKKRSRAEKDENEQLPQPKRNATKKAASKKKAKSRKKAKQPEKVVYELVWKLNGVSWLFKLTPGETTCHVTKEDEDEDESFRNYDIDIEVFLNTDNDEDVDMSELIVGSDLEDILPDDSENGEEFMYLMHDWINYVHFKNSAEAKPSGRTFERREKVEGRSWVQ
jgi:hypothetical protein